MVEAGGGEGAVWGGGGAGSEREAVGSLDEDTERGSVRPEVWATVVLVGVGQRGVPA